jgi:microcystin-dependent protein
MAEYNVDDIFRDDRGQLVFNEQDVYAGVDAIENLKDVIDNELDGYVKVTGDSMTGSLAVPNIELTNPSAQLKFSDGTYQNTALSDTFVSLTNNTVINTQYILKTDANETLINSDLKLGTKLIFPNTLGNQNYPYTDTERTANLDNATKTTAITYDSGLSLTRVSNNLFCDTLTCGNINTSHLSGTTSNLQTQINNLSSNATTTPIYDSIKLTNNTIDTTIDTLNQADYNNFKFNKLIEILPNNNVYRTFYIGSVGDNATSSNHFCVGVNAGGDPDPNIIFSLSSSNAYFYGVKQPLVPVGAVQIYAGLSNNIPVGYLLCNGALVSKTTFNLLFAVIGDTYLNGRTASPTSFYLPDLRGMFIRGVGTNTTYSGVAGGATTGTYQTDAVQKHSHKYDKANNTIDVSSSAGGALGNNSSVWDNSSDVMNTGSDVYEINNTTLLPDETRPHNISMNYIIKY